ncbi:DUF3397 family protein [Halobacillus litoralis]|uniref:DUF3397 family protein n=1 Tax=Halobacillus litoralis TaxID=45668 RepID=A0A845E049_9BACI|nr:DUF3397 domain-containing protein [Halobacillus litoralis]MYL19084.1 DUF3397 family protein [Halobacillus litoralis]
MSDWLAYGIAAVLTLPLPFLFVFYFFARKWSKHKWKAIHRTAGFTAPVFVMAVHVLLMVLFERSFFPFILIFLLLLLGVSIITQYKLKEEVQLFRAVRGFWRVSFLLFGLFYVGLSTFGLILRLFFS